MVAGANVDHVCLLCELGVVDVVVGGKLLVSAVVAAASTAAGVPKFAFSEVYHTYTISPLFLVRLRDHHFLSEAQFVVALGSALSAFD